MVFQMLLFKPNPLELNRSLKTADIPVPEPFPVRKSKRFMSPDSNPDDVDVDVAGAASACSAAGTAVASCETVVCVPVRVAWLPVAACAADPVAVVVTGGAANGVNVDAVAEDPA